AGPGFTRVNTGIVAHSPESAHLLDVDGDGRKDLLYVRSGVTYVRFLGDGGFGAEKATNVTTDLSPATIRIADFNGDGQDDIAKVNGVYGGSIYFSTGSNTFSRSLGLTTNAMSANAKVLDINGDGL